MNYLAHARHHLAEPYALVGTAIPDLLSIADRRCRLLPRHLPASAERLDAASAHLRSGISAHFNDDRWFHQTPIFLEVCANVTASMREAAGPGARFRASVLAHIGVEMLLDAELCRRDPTLLSRYFFALSEVSPALVGECVNRWAPRPALGLPWVLRFFRRAKFLSSYESDAGVALRLNQVARGARLGLLPDAVVALLPEFRALVRKCADGLLFSGALRPSRQSA